MDVRNAIEIERAIEAFASEPNGGMLAVPEVTVTLHRELVIGPGDATASPATQMRTPESYLANGNSRFGNRGRNVYRFLTFGR
jgi:hypothetical protein